MSYHHGDWHSRQAVLSNSLCGGVGGAYCRWRKQGLATIGQEQLSLCVLLEVKILHLMVPPGVLGNKRRRGYTNCILRDKKQCSICLGFSKWIYYIVQWGSAWYSFLIQIITANMDILDNILITSNLQYNTVLFSFSVKSVSVSTCNWSQQNDVASSLFHTA